MHGFILFVLFFGFGIIIALIAGIRAGQKRNYYYTKTLTDEIRRLEMLKKRGTISEEEFTKYKQKLLTDDSLR